jgi:hypothetical protein
MLLSNRAFCFWHRAPVRCGVRVVRSRVERRLTDVGESDENDRERTLVTEFRSMIEAVVVGLQ